MKVVFVVIFFLVGFAIGAICWTYAINEWLMFFGKDARLVWWQGGLIGFVPGIGHAGLPVAVLTWLLMLFIA